MNKSDLIDAVAKQADLSKTKAQEALEAVLSSIKGTLKRGKCCF